MLVKTEGIVISTINYSEKSVVARIFTQKFGLLSFIIQGVRSGKGAIRPSHLMLLNLLDLVIYKKETEGLHRIRELRCTPALAAIHADLTKSSVAVFMCEVLQKSLHEHEQDEPLYNYLYDSVMLLEQSDKVASLFPHWFMLGMCKFFGCLPKGNFEANNWIFDLQEGQFSPPSLYIKESIPSAPAELIFQLLNTHPAQLADIKVPYTLRKAAMDYIIRYLQLHVLVVKEIKSHTILHEVFS